MKYLRQWVPVPRGSQDQLLILNLGISTDEALRQKTSKVPWMVYRHPLLSVDDDPTGLGWSRSDCREYLDSVGWGDTPKSACVYCPYHSDELWAEVKALDPAGWRMSVDLDEAARRGTRPEDADDGRTYFFHRSLVPLGDVALPEYVPGATGDSVGCSPFSCPGDGSQISLTPEGSA